MTPINVPELVVMLPIDMDTGAIYDRFRSVLEVAPMSKTELAEEIGVSQATVSRWASGDARPSVEKMLTLVAAVEDRLDEIQRRAESARQVLEAVERVIEARKEYQEKEERTEDDRRKIDEATEEVRRLVGSD